MSNNFVPPQYIVLFTQSRSSSQPSGTFLLNTSLPLPSTPLKTFPGGTIHSSVLHRSNCIISCFRLRLAAFWHGNSSLNLLYCFSPFWFATLHVQFSKTSVNCDMLTRQKNSIVNYMVIFSQKLIQTSLLCAHSTAKTCMLVSFAALWRKSVLITALIYRLINKNGTQTKLNNSRICKRIVEKRISFNPD